MFAFDESSWFDAYYDLLSSFKYESYEEHIATKKLPKDIEKTLPIVEDGLPLWNCIRKYVENYLSVWYKNDEDVLKDLEIQSYWHYYGFLPCIGKPYGLPALSLNALIDQVQRISSVGLTYIFVS